MIGNTIGSNRFERIFAQISVFSVSLLLFFSCAKLGKKTEKPIYIPSSVQGISKEKVVNWKGIRLVQDEILVAVRTKDDLRKVILDVVGLTGYEPEILGGVETRGLIIVQLRVKVKDAGELEKVTEIISDNPDVLGITPNLILSGGAFVPNDSEWSEENWNEQNPEGKNWAFELVRLPSAWNIARGSKSVKIGVIDWGFNYLHDDLKENVSGVTEAGSYNFLNSRHGTLVAGIIGAKGMNLKGVAGVMFDVSLELCRTDGSLASIVWCAFELKKRGVRVINFSGEIKWDRNPEENPEESQEILDFVNSVFRQVFRNLGDVLFVQSAGNGGYDSKWAGAGASLRDEFVNIIVVGSVSSGLKRSSFSNKNPDIFAPGENIFSTCEIGYCLASGTSFSSPFVAGAAGLLLSLRNASASDLRDAIINGSALSGKIVEGKPVLDIFAVINEFEPSITGIFEPEVKEEDISFLEKIWESFKNIFFKPAGIGSLKWSYNLGAPSDAPASVDSSGNVYVGNDNGVLISLNSSGGLRWSVNIPSLPNSCPCVIKGAPAIDDTNGRLFVACGPNVWALSTANGSLVWGRKTGPIYGSPSIDFSGNIVVITKDGKVLRLNGSNGSVIWQLQLTSELSDASPTIAPDGSIYVATRSDGKIHKISSSGVLQWSYTAGDVKSGVALSCDGTIYVGNKAGNLFAINPNGTLKWTLSLGGEIKSVPAVDGNILYVTSGNKLFKIQDSGTFGVSLWSYTATGTVNWSSPALSEHNLVYFAGGSYLYAVSSSSSGIWSFNTGAEIRSSPNIAPDGTVYITSRNGYIYAIGSTGATKDTSWASSRYNEQGWGRGLLCTPQLTSLSYSAETFILNWTDVFGRYGFEVHRKVGSGLYSKIAEPVTTNYADSSLFEGQKHCYKVRATNTAGASKFSNELCDWAPPKTPTALDAFSTSSTQVQVNWSDNSSVENNYILQRKVGSGSWSVYQTLSANTSSYLDQGLNEGEQYCYRVSAVANTPDGLRYSDLSNQDCDLTPPHAPSNPNAVSLSASSIKFTWIDNSAIEDGFRIERRLFLVGTYSEIATVGPNVQEYIDTGLTPSTKYCYRVRAYKGSKNSTYTTEVCENTNNPPAAPPAAPSGLQIYEFDSYNVKLKWQDNSNNEDWFIIQRKLGAAGTYSNIASTPTNVTTYSDYSVLEAQTYYYRVSAANSAGYSGFSNEVNVTIPLLPASAVNAFAPNSAQVNITWSDNSTQNTGYKIYRNGSLYTTVGNVTSHNDTGVSVEQQYCYILTATGGGAPDSPASNQDCVRVLAAPTSLNATAISSSQIQLSFNDNSSHEDFYEIERRKSGDPTFDKVGEIACSLSPCQYVDSGLLSSTTYEYRVRARKGTKSYSSYSNVANATTLGPSASACVSTGGGVFSTGVTYGNLIIYGSKDGIVRAINRNTCAVVWTYNTGKQVWASPATSSTGRVYIGSRSGYLYALNAATGAEIWKCQVGGGVIASVGVRESSGTILIYVGSRDRKFYAIQDNGTSCSISWVYDTTADCAGDSGQIDSSTLVDPQGNVYFGSSNGYLYSLNQSGVIRWKTLIGELVKKPVFSSPAMSCQGKVYVVAREKLYEINYSTGAIERQFTIGTAGASLISSPTVTTDTVFVGGSDGLYAIWTTASALALRWKYTTPAPVTSAPAISGNGKVAFGSASGVFYVVQLATGTLDWSGTVATGAILSSPVITSGSIWFGSEDSGIYRVNIGVVPPESGKFAYTKFRHDFGNSGWFAPGLCSPWGLTSPYAHPGSVTLNWVTVNAFADFTEIERSPNGSSWSIIGSASPGSATHYTDTTAGEGNVYWYRVRAKNNLGYSGYSEQISVILPPFAPSLLNAQLSATSPHSIVDLVWTDNSAVEDGFRVQRSLNGITFSTVATLVANTLNFSNVGLSEVETYWYRVLAFKGALESAYSNTVSIITAPRSATGASAVAIDHETVSLIWYDNSSKENGFEVWRKIGASGTYQAVATLSSNTTSITDTALMPNTTYCYKVRAFANTWNGQIFSIFTDETCTTTPPAPPAVPAAPSNLTAYVISSTETVLTWQDNSGTETGFKVERSLWGGPYQVSATVGANIITYTDSATTDRRYCYRVKAFNIHGDSAPSNVTCVTLIAMPSNLTTGALSTSSIKLTWQDNSTQNTNYEIWQSIDGVNYTLLVNLSDVTTYDHTGLSEGSSIYYRIRAHANAITYSSFLTPVVGYSKPNAPTALSVVLTTSTAIKLSWNDNSSKEAGYILQRCTGASCTPNQVVANLPANSNTYTDTGLSANTTYCYRVSAYVGNAYSDFSNTVCGTTVGPGNISYQIQTGGAIYSSPAINNGIAYIGSDDKKLYAIETTTGTVLWTYTTGGAIRSSPAVGCFGEIYFGSDDGYLHSLTGNAVLRWNVQLSQRKAPIVSSPAFHPKGTTVYVTVTNHRLYAVNITDGSIAWVSSALPRPLRTSPFVSPNGATVYVVGVSRVYAFDANTGTQKWQLNINCSIETSPAVTPDGAIYVKGDDTLYRIQDNGSSGSVVWSIAIGKGESTPAVGTDGNIYVGGAHGGNVSLVKISPSGTVLSSYQTLGMINSHPSFATYAGNSTIFVGDTSGNLYAVNAGGMNLIWSLSLNGDIRVGPNIWMPSGILLVATTKGTIYGVSAQGEIPEGACPRFQSDIYSFGATRACPKLQGSPDPITAWAETSTRIQIKWTDTFSSENGFEIWKQQVGLDTNFVLLDTLAQNVTQYAHQSLPEATTVFYRVRAFAGSDFSNYTTTVSATTFPREPTGLSAQTLSANSITLTWYDNSTKEQGFVVERRPSSSSVWTTIHQVFTPNVTQYLNSGLSENTEFCYRVMSFIHSGNLRSLPSNENCARTRLNTPTGLVANAIGPNQIDLQWQDNSTQETSYEIWRKGQSDPDFVLITSVPGLSGTGVKTYSDTTVLSNTTYYYRVRATNTVPNWSEFSNVVSATTPTNPIPNPPSSLTTYTYSSTQINLTWQDNATNEVGFKVMRCVGSGCNPLSGTLAATVLSSNPTTTGLVFYENHSLSEYTVYCYCVSAYNSFGDSACSNTSCSTTFPHAPTGLTGTVAPDKITLYFIDNSLIEDGFKVERRLYHGGVYSQIAVLGPKTGTGSVTWEDTSIVSGTEYCYRVRSYKGSLNSLYSNSWCTDINLFAPTNLTAALYPGGVTLNWVNNAMGEDGTQIWRCSGLGCGTFSMVGTAPANVTYFVDTGLTEGYYCYKVRAYKGVSDFSGWSNIACVELGLVAPSGLQIISSFSTEVSSAFQISWNDNSSAETAYYVQSSTDGTNFTQIATFTANTTLATIQGLEEGKWYWFRVQAANSTTQSSYSNVVSAISSPYRPSFLKVMGGPATDVVIFSWQANSTTETGFLLKVRKDPGTPIDVTSPAGSESYFASLTEENTWCFSISSYIIEPVSLKVRGSGFTSEVCQYILGTPNPLLVERLDTIRLSWGDNSDGEDGYQIERTENAGVTWVQMVTLSSVGFFVDTSTTANKDYCYRVRAYKTIGANTYYSSYSEVRCVSTKTDGSNIASVVLGQGGNITHISSSSSVTLVYVATSTGYIYAVDTVKKQLVAMYNAGSSISGLCLRDYIGGVTVVATTSGGDVLKLRFDLKLMRKYAAGGQIVGCALTDDLYVGVKPNKVVRLKILELSPVSSITLTNNIESGPIVVLSDINKVYYVVEAGGDERRVCRRNLDLTSEQCTPNTTRISTLLSADLDGVFAGTSTGVIAFVPHSSSTIFTKQLTSPSESITRVITIYNRGAQKLLAIPAQDGSFYLVEVTRVPPYDSSLDVKIIWLKELGSIPSAPLMKTDRIVVGTGSGNLYSYRITDGVLIYNQSLGSAQILASPVVGSDISSGESGGNQTLSFIVNGGGRTDDCWPRSGGNSRGDNTCDTTPSVGGSFRIVQKWNPLCLGTNADYVAPTPVSFAGNIYYGFSATNNVDWIFRASPSGSVLSSVSYTHSMSWITSNLSVGDVLGSNPGNELVFGIIHRSTNEPGYIHVRDSLNLGNLLFNYPLPSTIKYVRGIALYDIVAGDSSRPELVFTVYSPNQKRAMLHVLDPDNSYPLVCSRVFAEHIWSIPLIHPSGIVIGGGGNDSSGNLYVLDSSCNIVKTISFAGHLKEGFLADVNGDNNVDWVGGLTQPNGANYVVLVSNIFGAHVTSTFHLGTLSDIPGRNTIRGIVPAFIGGVTYAVFVETAQLRADNYWKSFLNVVRFSSLSIIRVGSRFEVRGWEYAFPVVGDFDGARGDREIIIGLMDGADESPFYVFDVGSATERADLRERSALRQGEGIGSFGLSVTDIDSNQRLDLMVSGDKGCFYVFEIKYSGRANRNGIADVPHFRRDNTLNAVW
ncbi:MAG: PQQ-binding-like beta-propeller repeat protein [Candidatus Calescibacterium sp.]|nr:PQQ-binding-like beta-propeller repeat protein [Candidatus Calescibacterium sp.]